MTDPPDGEDPILALAEQVGRLATSVEDQTTRLTEATDAIRRHRRATWLAYAALVVVVVVAIGSVTAYAADRTDDARARRLLQCQRDNAIRESSIDLAEAVIVSGAIEVGRPPAEAERLATQVVADAVRDSSLELRDCG